MSATRIPAEADLAADSFRHEALLYQGESGFIEGTLPFILDARAGGETVMVAVSAARIDLLRDALDGDSEGIWFSDMGELGRNPARIIPTWREFLGYHAARGKVRGIAEPISPDREPAELAECQRHESLLNLAFDGEADWWLLCPYDVDALDDEVIAEAQRSHPFIAEAGTHRRSKLYREPATAPDPLQGGLPEPSVQPDEIAFTIDELATVRNVVLERASRVGIGDERAWDLVLAVNEVATNSLRHAGGHGTLRSWTQGETLVCEIRDGGRIDDPLVGRERPASDPLSGRGLWLVNQVCDLVQVRSLPTGSVVRLHMSARA